MNKYYQETKKEIETEMKILPEIIEKVFLQLLNKMEVKLVRQWKQVSLTGCGDSWIAPQAAFWAYKRLTSLDVLAVPSLEFSRFHIDYVTPGSAVICVSSSGKVSRTIEAAVRAKQKGLFTIAVTKDPGSKLTEIADLVMETPIPSPPLLLPGTLSYLASLTALYVMAIFFAESRGDITSPEADDLYYKLKKSAETMTTIFKQSQRIIDEFLKENSETTHFHFLGSGPVLPIANYGVMKVLEATAMPSLAYDIEEWAHAGFFLVQKATAVILLSIGLKAKDRLTELLHGIEKLQAPHLVICDQKSCLKTNAATILSIENVLPDELLPLLFSLPMQVLAMELIKHKDTVPFDSEDEDKLQMNSRLLYESPISRLAL